jgi:phosphomannomutase
MIQGEKGRRPIAATEVGAEDILVSGQGIRIASISGLRGVVGNGIDPVVAAEFAAAYASECDPGPIVVGHDGRVSAPIFMATVEAAVAATGHDVFLAGPAATPTIGVLVRDLKAAGGIQISASHNPPTYNGLKFFQQAGMVLSRDQGAALLDRWQRRDFRWAGWDSLGRASRLDDPDRTHLERVLAIVDKPAIKRRAFKVALDACHGAGGRLGTAMLEALGCRTIVLGGQPDGRYDHPPEPTEANLREFSAVVKAVGASVGFAQDPDADRLAIVDETGRYIGEELTLALAAVRRLGQAKGTIALNLSTSRVTEELARRAGCAVVRTPVGEINVVERMLSEHALLAGEGNGGVIDPRVGYVRDSFVAMALVLDLMAATGETTSDLVRQLPRFFMVKEQYPLAESSSNELAGSSQVAWLWDRIAAGCPDASADRRDGLRLDWHDRWVHMRASNTEPIVRVIAEAADGASARELADRAGGWIKETAEGEP